MTYPVLEVPENAAEVTEWMGTKEKFWYRDPRFGRTLFKLARLGTGEDWAEKLACELAELLGIPHARYELATWMGRRGTATPSLVAGSQTLIHGNELLMLDLDDYPAPGDKEKFRNSQHTLNAVLSALQRSGASLPLNSPDDARIVNAPDVFVGYLMLDALIGNTDRHHENWAVIEHSGAGEGTRLRFLAPTYDHASSLGRNETESNILRRLTTKDDGYSVAAYARRAPSALYASPEIAKPLTTFEAFTAVSELVPVASRFWIERLSGVDVQRFTDIILSVPPHLMSEPAAEFVSRILRFNYDRLRALR